MTCTKNVRKPATSVKLRVYRLVNLSSKSGWVSFSFLKKETCYVRRAGLDVMNLLDFLQNRTSKKKDLQSNFFPAFIRSENCFWIVPFYIQIESSERPFSIWFKFFHIRDFIPKSFWFLTYILLGKMMKCLAKKLRQTIEPRFFPKKELVIFWKCSLLQCRSNFNSF